MVIQVGRARRGEVLTAGQGIRGAAATALLKVFTRQLPHDQRLDKLDVSRRFEFAHPEIGHLIADALAQEPEATGMDLLKISDEHLAPLWSQYPFEEVQVVRDVLAWTS